MQKKVISLVILCVIALSAGVYYYIHQPKNIFDEIYQETKKTYRSNNILGQIKGFEIRGSWPTDDSNISQAPFGEYKEDSSDYSDITVGFNFKSNSRLSSITFEKNITSQIAIKVWSKYTTSNKVLKKYVKIVLKDGNSNSYIEDESKVKSYLQDYGITAVDLESYYNEIVNQKVLTDWCSIYDSKFSPGDYGDVTVKTQWENW